MCAFEKIIKGKKVSKRSFFNNLETYMRSLSNESWEDNRGQHDEIVKTFLPLRTFLTHNETFTHVQVFQKSSDSDKKGIDAIIYKKGSEVKVQITLAGSDFKQNFLLLVCLYCKSGNVPVLSGGKIYTSKEEVSNDRCEEYEEIPLMRKGQEKVWYQEKHSIIEVSEQINEIINDINKAIETKIQRKNELSHEFSILLIGFSDWIIDDKKNFQEQLLKQCVPIQELDVYVVGISKSDATNCFYTQYK